MNFKLLFVAMLLLICTTQAFALTDANLQHYYDFNESSGKLIDKKNADNNGTTTNITYSVAGKNGNAYEFNGASSKVVFDNNNTFIDTAEKTISFWFNPDVNSAGLRLLYITDNNPAPGSIEYRIYQDAALLRFYGYNAGYQFQITTGSIINAGTWTYVVATMKNNDVNLWVNNVLRGSDSASSNPTSGGTDSALGTQNGSNWFDGKMDELAVFNKVLPESDINALYNSGSGVTYCTSGGTFATTCAGSPVAQVRLTFNIYRKGTSDHLTGVNLDSNIAAWDFTNQTSPQTTSYVDINTAYDLNFSKTGYDANYSTGVADSNKTLTIYLMDSTAPIVGSPQLVGYTTYNSTYIKGTGTISATATDSGSDINASSCYYSINNGSNWLSADKNATHCYKALTITDQNYTFKFKAIDNAGNTGTGTASSTYVGDTTAPTTTATITQVVGTTDTNITLTCDDGTGSGCNEVNYRINGGAWTTEMFNSLINNSGLWGYYNFDEGSGDLLDQSGNGYDGTNTSVSYSQLGKINTAYNYADGISNYTEIPETSALNVAELSIAFWYYPNANGAKNILYISKQAPNTDEIRFATDAGNKLMFYVYVDSGYSASIDCGSVTAGSWYYIVATSKQDEFKCYINAGAPVEDTSGNVNLDTAYTTGYFGGVAILGEGNNGKLDEMSIWTRILSAAEITTLYNAGSGLAYPFGGGIGGNSVNFLYSGAGDHNIEYFSSDNLDTNESPANIDYFTTTGYLNINTYDESSLSAFTGNINFNGTDYNATSSVSIDLNGIADGNYKISFTYPNYGARYYIIALTEFTDTNINMLMLSTAQGSNLKFTLFQPDQLTIYPNATMLITRPDKNNFSIGTYLTNANGKVTIFTNLYDQNYLFNINDGEEIYQPVALTIKKPIDEETGVTIATNYQITISGAGSQDYNDVINDKVIWLLPNIDLAYKIKIQDVNSLYFPRNYYKNYYGNPLTDTLQPYLISALTGLLTTIRSISGTSNAPIPLVNVKIYKDLQSGRTLVEDIITDYKGESLAYMVTGDQYYFDIYFNGVLVRSDTIQATSSLIYIRLDDLVYSTPIFGNISANVNFFPSVGALSQADKKLIQVIKINDSNSTTTITAILIQVWNTDRNGVAGSSVKVYEDYSVYADENSITNTIDINALTQIINGTTWYDTNGFLQVKIIIITSDTNYISTFSYKPFTGFNAIYSIGFGSRTLFGCSSYYDSYGNPNPLIPCPNQLFIALFISFILTAGIGFGLKFNSPAGLGIIFALIMGIFTFLTFVPIVLYGIMVAGLGVLIIVGRGRFN